tara:strand:+ start:21056 stop:23527 length:2472 start_codon:yes stop_codon:yes gene_type:complete
MSNFYSKWKHYLQEAQQDAKVLRKINIDRIRKEMPQLPEEETRDYFSRIQALERDPEYLNPIFPQGIVDWVESLPDNHFPTSGRKRFAKWLGNTIYHQETEIQGRLNTVDNPEELRIYNNDVRYIADYLNGADELPEDLWDRSLNGMYDLAVEWHDTLKYKEDPTGDYQNKDVVYKFDNGYTIVDVNTENDLSVEGDKMGHCVGSYCDYVASGETTIYSLRDPRNEPHATIEVIPTLPLGRTRSRGRVDQIKGKGNAAPVEKYRPMLKQWLQTTEFSYESSPDYLNILSADELREKLFSGELGKDSEQSLARTTDDPEIIQFFLDQIVAAGYTYGGSSVDLVTKLNPSSITDYLLRNDNLNEEHRLSLVKINFKLRNSVLGVRMSRLLGAMGHSGPRNFDPESLSSRVWGELGDELTSGYSDEKLYCMQAIMEVAEAPSSIKEEIINHLLSDEYLQGAVAQNPNALDQQQQPYGAILQGYLFQKSPSQEQVKKLYTVQRDENFIKVLGQYGRLNGYISSSRGMSDELADEIIEDVKNEERHAFMSRNWLDMIMNPRLSDSKKIQILNIGHTGSGSIVSMTQPNEPTSKIPGLKFSVSARSYSRQLYNAAREKKFSKKLVKYMIDAGVFDAQYVNVWVGQRVKMSGSDPRIEKYSQDEKQKVLDIVRSRQLQEFESGLFDEDLFEEMNNYFRKNTMTKNKFYDNIKEQLEISEEKGRSRQRGIYKFHCMIAYNLTVESNRTRGLDDILADLRALENVTIVTVAIRNQKIGDGRYIAGLAVKFIPSTPGNMGTPENTKARIVKDIKRINNVQSLFKLSAGLIRLE